MKHFEYTLSTFPQGKESEKFKKYACNLLNKEIEKVQNGENKEVEKRYKYYVDYLWLYSVLNYSFKKSKRAKYNGFKSFLIFHYSKFFIKIDLTINIVLLQNK